MKHYRAGVAAIAVSIMMTALFSIDVWAMEEETIWSAGQTSVSDADLLVSEDKAVFSVGNGTEESVVTVDVSDMVYQAGGWGIPVEERAIAPYTLDTNEQLKNEILIALLEEKDKLDVSKYNLTREEDWDAVKILFAEVLNEHPELFYVDSRFGFSGGSLYFFYSIRIDKRQALAEKLDEASSLVTPDMTDTEKALVMHDYLAQHCAYAYAEYLEGTLSGDVFNAYGALVEGKAVCQGYAEAYNLLLRTVGINSDLCSSSTMNHAWNVVLVDGEWYHVDVTWDDPVWNTEGMAGHTYFLLSDAEMENRKHEGWTSAVECTSSKYDAEDYWWISAKSSILPGDKQYYIESTGRGFQLTERDENVKTAKYVNNTVWEVWGSGTSYWIGSYSYLSRQGDYLYFNDKQNLYAMRLTDSAPRIIYTYNGGDGYIYGAMVYEDGIARLNIGQSPNRGDDSFITVDLRAEAPKLTIDYETGTIYTTADMEYSIDNGATWNSCTENMKITDLGWNGSREVTVSFRISSANGGFASATTEVTLKALPGTIRGDVVCFGGMNARTKLRLLDGSENSAAETTVIGSSAEYVLESVEGGIYTLQASSNNHVTREYEVMIGENAVTQDVELHLTGDVNGDGGINARDKKLLYNHIAGLTLLEDYDFAVADVNGDGSVNARDKKIIYNHIAGISLLW